MSTAKFLVGARRVIGFATLALWCAAPLPANAQSYPNKPIRLIVPFPPGGGTDIIGRMLAQKLAENLGQQIVIDNRGGAGGNLGAGLAATSPADGYTALIVSASYAVNAAVYKLSFDQVKDLAPVAQVGTVPFVLLAHPSLQANNAREMIALAELVPAQGIKMVP